MLAATILAVDDDAAIRELWREAFAGYRVIAASNGAQALHLLGQARPDLVLLDLTMPILGGLGAAQELRRCGSPIPTLTLSARDEVSRDAQLLGARWLGKLFDQFVLLATVECYCPVGSALHPEPVCEAGKRSRLYLCRAHLPP